MSRTRDFPLRKDHEPPPAASRLGWRYHHLGIPSMESHSGERYLEHLKMTVCGFNTSLFGVEWMRFDADCDVPEIVRRIPHVAFEVDDLDKALEGFEVLVPPGVPSEGVRAAVIVENGAPIELIEFRIPAGVSGSER